MAARPRLERPQYVPTRKAQQLHPCVAALGLPSETQCRGSAGSHAGGVSVFALLKRRGGPAKFARFRAQNSPISISIAAICRGRGPLPNNPDFRVRQPDSVVADPANLGFRV